MRRAILVLLVMALLGVACWAGWQGVRERYVLPAIGSYLARQVERRSGWRLNYRGISGNLLTQLRLSRVRLEPVHPPAWLTDPTTPLAITANEILASYRPLEMLRGRVGRVEVEGCRIQLGSTTMQLSVMQLGDLTAVSWPTQRVSLDALRGVLPLPARTSVEGDVYVGGEWLLKAYQPHLMQVRLHGQDLRLRWIPSLDVHLNADLELNGPSPTTRLDGVLEVIKGRWSGVTSRPLAAVLGADELPFLRWTRRVPGTMRVQLTGGNFWVHSDKLHAKFQADNLVLEKEPATVGNLRGRIESVEGSYHARNRRFQLREASLLFLDSPQARPQISALLETRIKRYRIRAAYFVAPPQEAHLQLTSIPELSQEDILSLMVFGRKLDRLSFEERQQLAIQQTPASSPSSPLGTETNAGSQALDLLVGPAEQLAAKWLGLDEINISMSPTGTRSSTGQAPIESVEIGKYVIPNRLFGSYQLEPRQSATEMEKHTVGAEYELNDNMSVEATVKAALKDQAQPALQPPDQSHQSKRLETEEALVRFRWKF